jgi:hypothetical protein
LGVIAELNERSIAIAADRAIRMRVAASLLMIAIIAGATPLGMEQALAQPTSVQRAPKQNWPPLPTSGFISGRPATDKDIVEGNAVFALRAYGVPFGKPLDVVIPQYAYLTKRGGEPIAVIVVQAELGKGLKIFGVRDLNGKTATARDSELQLLGTRPPD